MNNMKTFNPKQYEFIPIVKAMESYQNYVNYFSVSVANKFAQPKELKDFQEYLTTEI